MELTQEEQETQQIMNDIRNPDSPRFKESIIAELHGKFLGFIDSQGLTKGKEYESQTQEIFQCSKRVIHIFDQDKSKDCQIVVHLLSTQFMLEFGIYNKVKKEVVYRNKLENLRYKISPGTKAELIDSHQEKFDLLFEDFKNKLQELEK